MRRQSEELSILSNSRSQPALQKKLHGADGSAAEARFSNKNLLLKPEVLKTETAAFFLMLSISVVSFCSGRKCNSSFDSIFSEKVPDSTTRLQALFAKHAKVRGHNSWRACQVAF